ncbi:MAG: cyclase family protein [Bacteroidales bacterium]|nr:cyclase family protein [Bacteroidales bacterium]MBN2757332.1 cyclase family protein [Bacteroidales bacterium]
MKIIDLSHTIEESMTVYPGSAKPIIEKIIYPDFLNINVQKYIIEGHIGTHIDTPKHFFLDKKNTENCDLLNFYGKAIVLDSTKYLNNGVITSKILDSVSDLNSYSFIIFYTSWSKKWKTESYFNDFPVISKEMAEILSKSGIKGVGFDAISIDPISDTEFINHNIVLGADKIIIENLTNLESLINIDFTISCLPLKFKNGDGSPVRAVAIF